MSPSHSRHSSPALPDDDIISVFLRIPPDDPARLVRASLVCKAWRRILTGPDFCRLYREFHGTPPMLGFVLNFWTQGGGFIYQFLPTTTFPTASGLSSYPDNWKAVDSRHGRILVEPVNTNGDSDGGYIVWDPITGGHWGVPFPRFHRSTWTSAVLCAKEHCDHLGCHGPPFLVATVASKHGTTSACFYSSESGVWSDIITLKHRDKMDPYGRSILVGNTLYFRTCSVLKYNLGEQKLSVIDLPAVESDENLAFISVEDDVLVFAGFRGTTLSLWSTKVGALEWAKRTVIDLEKLLPTRAFGPYPHLDEDYEYGPYVSGFTEGAVFLSTMVGLFTVELNSGRTKKIAEVEMAINVIPWISFYTQDRARPTTLMPQP